MSNNTRLSDTDGIMEITMKMSEGNPGALNAIIGLMQKPDGIMYVLACDMIGIYGSRLYMLWNDCCGRSFDKFIRVIKGWQAGKLKAEEILEHVSGGWGTPFEGLDDED